MAKYGLYIDLSRCIGCYSCVVGCKNWHKIRSGEKGRIVLHDKMYGEFPKVSRWIFPLLCMQCENPPCVSVCPHKATYKREDGIIVMDSGRCVGCGLCVDACPYGLRYLDKSECKVDACDFCSERVDSGSKPYCVSTCPTDALIFGDLDDSNSLISTLTKDNETCRFDPYGTMPKIFYGMMKRENEKDNSFSLAQVLEKSVENGRRSMNDTEKKNFSFD